MKTDELPLIYRQIFAKLKEQIDTALSAGLKSRSLSFIEEFAYTYLRGLSFFSRIKTNPNLQKYRQPCQKLLIQANLILYPEESTSLKELWRKLWVQLPAQLWENRYFHLLSLGICLVTGFIGFMIVRQNFEMASVFIPPGLRSTHDMEAYLFSDTAQHEMLTLNRGWGVEAKSAFAWFLLINNTRVAIMCFISGFLFGIPTVIILIQTGLMAGTLPALFYGGDIAGLWAWLLPHGVPEFSAIILAGGAGLRLGFTMLNPGEAGMGSALKKALKKISGTIVICTLLLIWAAIVESFIRQSELSNSARYSIAMFSVIPLALLFIRAYFAHNHLRKELLGSP